MSDQLYSAEEAAKILGLQVRTVRNYVREGRLAGVRIGKQYRIARSALDAFAGTEQSRENLNDAAPQAASPPTATEVSSVVQVDHIAPIAADRIVRTLTAATVTRSDEAPRVQMEPIYDAERLRLKVIIVGSTSETVELIRIVELLARETS